MRLCRVTVGRVERTPIARDLCGPGQLSPLIDEGPGLQGSFKAGSKIQELQSSVWLKNEIDPLVGVVGAGNLEEC